MDEVLALRAALEQARADAAAAQDELTRRSSFMAALMETIDVGIVSCDAQGKHITRNRALRDLQGMGLAAATTNLQDAASSIQVLDVHGQPLAVDDYPLVQALSGRPGAARVELLIGPVEGPQRHVVTLNSQIRSPGGELLGAVSCLTDVTAERLAMAELARERTLLADAQRLGRLGSLTVDLRTGKLSCSDELLRIWGLPPAADFAEHWESLILPEDRERVVTARNAAVQVPGHHQCEHRIRRPDGEIRHLRTDGEVTSDAQGRPQELHETHLDITELVLAEVTAREALAFTSAVLTASPDYTFITDVATGAVVYGSKDHDVLGLSSEQLKSLGAAAASTLIHPDDQPTLLAANVSARTLADGELLQFRYRGRHTDGTWRWLHRRATPFRRGDDGLVVEILGVARDVTDLVEAEERLAHAALHDILTGLPNRALLSDRLARALARADQRQVEVAVLFCDLDGFKYVNDTSGHSAGDAVLVETARRLRMVLREHDTVARVGGDEFVVLVEPWDRPSGNGPPAPGRGSIGVRLLAPRLAERIIQVLREPITTADGTDHIVTASIGITYAGPHVAGAPASADTIMQDADAAMYRAKKRGKDRFEVFGAATGQ